MSNLSPELLFEMRTPQSHEHFQHFWCKVALLPLILHSKSFIFPCTQLYISFVPKGFASWQSILFCYSTHVLQLVRRYFTKLTVLESQCTPRQLFLLTSLKCIDPKVSFWSVIIYFMFAVGTRLLRNASLTIYKGFVMKILLKGAIL